ncbi:TetR family transcriptional regulator [Streptomyces mashuensis]|uniref:TetR family transcriptional regulator n=1 Tax=Streptomyces mashuensis TaxID=33904 RepID=A0A919EET7_9ACTN|nr:TetR/AcrR family transcriptional regulator [Streptomyces mashuensis]GHF57120.1 TetR family transcriptional regulator [Streptomyces mashuensis]
MTAEERRESVVRAAMTEFARGGYNGTSTEAIARRVGVSQPYLFRLFPNKQAIFVAAAVRCMEETRDVFVKARERAATPEDALSEMAAAYQSLIAENPDMLLLQMQVYVAVASAEAAGDDAFGRTIRDAWLDLWDSVHLSLGADEEQTTEFLAYGMLINTLVSLGFPAGHRVWRAFHIAARPE